MIKRCRPILPRGKCQSQAVPVFHKTRMRDEREIDRARRALALGIDEAHEVVDEEG